MRLISCVPCGPYARSEPHHHPWWEIGCYTAGRGRAWIGERLLPVATGTIVLYPPHLPHHERADPPFSGIFLLIDQLPLPPPATVVEERLEGVAFATARLLVEVARDGDDARVAVRHALLEALLADLLRPRGEQLHPAVVALARRLQEGVADPACTVASASRGLRVSRDHLRRLFQRVHGEAPHAYLARLRIERAQRLLTMGRSVTQVAAEAGFRDPYYFSRAFRATTGVSPSRWSSQRGR